MFKKNTNQYGGDVMNGLFSGEDSSFAFSPGDIDWVKVDITSATIYIKEETEVSDITVIIAGRTPTKIAVSNNNRELLITQTGYTIGRLIVTIIVPVNVLLPYHIEVTSGSVYINNIACSSATVINHQGSVDITKVNIQDKLNITVDSGSVKMLDINGGNHIAFVESGSIIMNNCNGDILDIKATTGTVKGRDLSY